MLDSRRVAKLGGGSWALRKTSVEQDVAKADDPFCKVYRYEPDDKTWTWT